MTKQKRLNEELIGNATNGNLKKVKYLIEQGADIEAKDIYGYTALIWSSFEGRLEVVKYLIEQGADVNVKSKYGNTALIQSSGNGNLEVVKCLVDNGVDVNTKNKDDDTALTLSIKYNRLDIVNYLISYIYDYKAFEDIYNELEIEQKHILFEHFMNNRELLEQVNPRKMKGFIPDINKYKDNLK